MCSEQSRKKVRELCQTLVRQGSLSGNESAVAGKVMDFMNSNGFDSVDKDKYGSVLGCIKGNRPGPKILFDAHMDEVPVSSPREWKYPPFEAQIHDDKIYGRGTSDMKGALAAMLVAAADFSKKTKRDFPGKIYVSGVVHEECFEGIAARLISEKIEPDYVIIGEATGLNLRVGQRGRAEVIVETFGVPAHSANPEKGVNALIMMTELVQQINQLPLAQHPVLGKGILVPTDIISSPYPGASVIPEYCKVTFDRRLLVGETRESVIKPIQNLIDDRKQTDRQFDAKVGYANKKADCYTGEKIEAECFFPAWLYDENEAYVKKVANNLEKKGFCPDIGVYGFCTNGSHYGGEKAIKTLGIGPSYENLAHVNDEYIDLSQLYDAVKVYMAVNEALLTERG